jgi:hypothetical protein
MRGWRAVTSAIRCVEGAVAPSRILGWRRCWNAVSACSGNRHVPPSAPCRLGGIAVGVCPCYPRAPLRLSLAARSAPYVPEGQGDDDSSDLLSGRDADS